MPAAPKNVSITIRARTESPHRRRYNIQPATIRPMKPIAPANEASTTAPAQRVMMPSLASVEVGILGLQSWYGQFQRLHCLLECLRVVPVPPYQETGTQSLNRLFPTRRVFGFHLAHDWSPPPHDSLLSTKRPTW